MTLYAFCQKHKTKKVCSVIGACLLLSPNTINFFWGNLSSYVISYIYRDTECVSPGQTSLVTSLFLMLQGITIIPSGYLIPILGSRLTALCGSVIFNVGLFASYFAIQHSMALLNVTLGVVCGVGSGLFFGCCIKYGAEWSNTNDLGLINGLIQNSYTVVGIFVNFLVTAYINPNNKTPNLKLFGKMVVFTQADVLARVPQLFILLGIGSTCLQIVGFLLVRGEGDGGSCKIDSSNSYKSSSETKLDTSSKNCELSSLNEKNYCSISDRDLPNPLVTSSRVPSIPSPSNKDVTDEKLEDEVQNVKVDDEMQQEIDVTPKDLLLRTPSFYVMTVAFFMSEYSFIMVTVYYKTFGQLWISDDYFLTEMGMSFIIFMAVVKVLLCILIDKVGFKVVLLACQAVLATSCAMLYISAQLNRWFYFVMVVVAATFSGSIFLINTVGMVQLYGRRHAVINVGLLNMATIASSLTTPLLINLLLQAGDWQAVLFTGASLPVVGMVLAVIGIPHKPKMNK